MKRTFLTGFLAAAGAIGAILGPSVCSGATLNQTSPNPTAYVEGVDFLAMAFSASGDVTADIQAVDLLIPPTGGSTSGCEAADFAGFVPGNIALIQRGTCFFRDKALNAKAAGAVGVLIFNEGNTPAREPVFAGSLVGPGVTIPVLGTSFALGEDLYDLTLLGDVEVHMFVRALEALSPAKVWVGLKNSDAVGLRVDLKAEVLFNGDLIGLGELDNQSTGSSGFNNAQLKMIDLVSGWSEVATGDTLAIRLSARRTCFGGGHNSGTVRLWYNGQPVDSGTTRDAGSRFDATIGGVASDYFLRNGLALDTTAGSSRLSADAPVDSKVACPGRPFTVIATWSTALP